MKSNTCEIFKQPIKNYMKKVILKGLDEIFIKLRPRMMQYAAWIFQKEHVIVLVL